MNLSVRSSITSDLRSGYYTIQGNTMLLSEPAWARDLAASASNASIGFCANH